MRGCWRTQAMASTCTPLPLKKKKKNNYQPRPHTHTHTHTTHTLTHTCATQSTKFRTQANHDCTSVLANSFLLLGGCRRTSSKGRTKKGDEFIFKPSHGPPLLLPHLSDSNNNTCSRFRMQLCSQCFACNLVLTGRNWTLTFTQHATRLRCSR